MPRSTTIRLPDASEDLPPARGRVLFVGTATTVIQLGGFTLLTDPSFLHAGDHVHLGYGLTSRRRTNPALEIDQLPRLDACILSHLHGDHWDPVASARLPHELPIVTTRDAANGLGRQGFRRTYALATWDVVTLARGDRWARITAVPGKHAPGLLQPFLPSVMGSMVEWGRGSDEPAFRLWISGDTLMHDALREIPARFPHIPLALLHLGGTRLLGVRLTMDAEQGVQAMRLVRPRTTIPIHSDDYDVFRSPITEFADAVQRAGLAARVQFLARGQAYEWDVPALTAPAERRAAGV